MFAGIGGICLGFKQAGADIVWTNEIDRHACLTYRHNFGGSYLVESDIRNIDLAAIPDIDVLTAGFPCQSFSVMGNQKGFADPRGTMYFEILRVIDVKRPPVVFLENVKNLVNHDNGRTFQTIYATLAERGYGVKYAVLGANTHANIPQYRDRIFIVAFLDYDKLERFRFPEETPLTKSVNDLIDRNMPAEQIFYYGTSSKYYETLLKRITDDTVIYRIDDSGVAMRTWDICPTLKANMGTYHDRVPLIRDLYGIRKLTPDDCLALQGFPQGYSFPNIPLNEIYKQLGNTVCVPVVTEIVKKLRSK
jgi:DNA (cytosine-5)-methyltransferase 1